MNPPRHQPKVWLVAALLTAAILLAYAGTFRVPLLLDDESSITDNPTIRRLTDLAQVFSPPPVSATAGRPFANLTFALNHAISGTDPWSYHVLNLIIHVLAALTLFGVVRRTLLLPSMAPRWSAPALGLAGAGALLWGLHPLATQSVTYLSQRTEALMALFYLLAMYGYLRGLGGNSGRWHTLSVAACLLGALSKEVIVTAPLLVWLHDRTFAAGSFRSALRTRPALYAGLAATWLVTAGLMLDVRSRGVGFGLGISSFDYALTQCKAVSVYLQLSLWPDPLVFDRGYPVLTSLSAAWPYALLLAGLLAVTGWALRRHPQVGFLPAAFFLLLAPASSVVPVVGATIAENRVYLPLAAMVTLVVLGTHGILGGRRARAVYLLIAAATLAATISRNRDYQSEIRLWTDTVNKVPDNPRAHNNLALQLTNLPDRQAEAWAHYVEALRLKPDFADAHNNLGVLLSRQPDRQAEAMQHISEAIRLKPDHAGAHHNLAFLLAAMPGRQPEAQHHYTQALRLKPDYVEAHNNLGILLATISGREAEARAHYSEVLRLRPDYAEAHNNLAALLARMPGGQAEALHHYGEALRLKPGYVQALNNRSLLLASLPGRQAEALADATEAVRLEPNLATLHLNLANLLAVLPGRQADAIVQYAETLRLQPDHGEAHHNLAILQAPSTERWSEAWQHLREAARLLPRNPAVHFSLAVHLERRTDRRAEAAAAYAKVLEIDPNFAAARTALERLRK